MSIHLFVTLSIARSRGKLINNITSNEIKISETHQFLHLRETLSFEAIRCFHLVTQVDKYRSVFVDLLNVKKR